MDMRLVIEFGVKPFSKGLQGAGQRPAVFFFFLKKATGIAQDYLILALKAWKYEEFAW